MSLVILVLSALFCHLTTRPESSTAISPPHASASCFTMPKGILDLKRRHTKSSDFIKTSRHETKYRGVSHIGFTVLLLPPSFLPLASSSRFH